MKLSWTKSNLPWFNVEGFIDLLVDKVNILDILDIYGIEYQECNSGDFTHRLKCPFITHAGGEERTPSFFVSEKQNRYFCYGCSQGGGIIDFVSIYAGKPKYEAIKWLCQQFELFDLQNDGEVQKKEKIPPEKTIAFHVYQSGIKVRNFIESKRNGKDYRKWCDWADKIFVRLDKFSNELENNDWEKVFKYYRKINSFLRNR